MAWDLFLGMLLVDLACIFLSSYREHSTYLRNTDAPDWCVCVCVWVCVHAQSCLILCDFMDCSPPWNCSPPLSMEFFRQEYWSVLPFPAPGDLPDPGIKPVSLDPLHWQADSWPLSHLGSPIWPVPHNARVVWWRGKAILHFCRLFSWLSHASWEYNISCQKLVTFSTYIFKARV